MEDAVEQIVEAWRTNGKINTYLIDRISSAGMKSTLSTRGGRSVVRQFAHLHNVRIYHLEKRAKDLLPGLEKFATADEPSKRKLKSALAASGTRIETLLADCARGERRGFRKGAIVYLGYFISHESHHRGNILLTLKQSGHKLDQATVSAIWGGWDRF